MAKRNTYFNFGLGSGLGYIFTYLDKEMQKEIIDIMKKDPEFVYGFQSGYNRVSRYISNNN